MGRTPFLNHEICLRKGYSELMGVNYSAGSGGIFPITFNVLVCYVFSLKSPHGEDSNENTKYIILNIKKKNHTK